MNLIANSGIQYYCIPLEINMNDNFKMFFHEWFDVDNEQLKLEIAHNFTEDELWVKKRDLSLLGYLTDGKVGRIEDGKFISYKWEEIEKDFYSEGNKTITPMEDEDGGSDCFPISLNKCRFEKLENRWLPFPFFSISDNGKSNFGPTNWCRIKIIPESSVGNKKTYNLLLAFDTRSLYESENFEDEDLNEAPVFVSEYDKSKEFALCNNEFSLLDFCSKSRQSEWVDEHVFKLFYPTNKNINELRVQKPKLSYLAQYIYLIGYIQQLNVLPKITLFSDKNVAFCDVDLVVDMGNSRTCAILFDDSDFTKVEQLSLQNFSNPIKNGLLNKNSNSFDMRLAFREADFGGNLIEGSTQFTFPSLVRLGTEANELIHKAVNLNTGLEKITTFSSPKRYLWDNKPQQIEWEFVTLKGEQNKPIWIKGVSEHLNSDGSLNTDRSVAIEQHYSRKALMTFGFLELLAQAKMQINSYEYRNKWGNESTPRKIGKIIITCPSAMSRVEQIAIRKCADEAAIILERFYKGSAYSKDIEVRTSSEELTVIPSVRNLSNKQERKEWIYDEATSAQFVFLYAEITKRYRNNCKEYFEFYGKVRNDLGDYKKKSVTVGSGDIGAGTTDVMIASYKYEESGQCAITPVPLFWESFYVAGDDLLKDLIRKLVIEGPYAAIQKELIRIGQNDISKLILNFFGEDDAQKDIKSRQIRSEFNLQVSVPVVSRFLEILNENKVDKIVLKFSDIFEENTPTDRVLEHFKNHFGFSVESLQWSFDKEIISKIVENIFDSLTGKISTLLSYYGCDIVLLSGRPTSLKPLSDLFLKYYAVSPNRLITLNNYRIGTWYPFQNGEGFFKDAKSIVAVGAMIGNYSSTRGTLNGFTLDLSELIKKMLPTTEYFSKAETEISFITPKLDNATLEVSQLPLRIWTRQLEATSYPTRPFYILDFNFEKIQDRIKDKLGLENHEKQRIKVEVARELERLKKLSPFTINIIRDNYLEDKELLKIQSVVDKNNDDLAIALFSLQVQSMSESESYWLDTGAFTNLNPTHN